MLKIVPVQITMIASALFITSPGQPWSDQSLRALQSISKADPQQVQVDNNINLKVITLLSFV